MSISNAGDVEGASVSAEGNTPDVESNLESQPVSVAVSAVSSPVPPARSLELPTTQAAVNESAEPQTVAEVEVPSLSDADFPALPSAPANTSSKGQGKRSQSTVRAADTKPAGSAKKTTLTKKAVTAAAQKSVSGGGQSASLTTGSSSQPATTVSVTPVKKEEKAGNLPSSTASSNVKNKQAPRTTIVEPRSPEPATIAPFLSRKTRKVKAAPVIKPPKKPLREVSQPAEDTAETPETESAGDNDNGSASPNIDVTPVEPEEPIYLQEPFGKPASLSQLLSEVGRYLDVEGLAFFDTATINTKGQSNIRYAPLVHALSTLSSGTSFTGSMPNSSIDSAVSSFQQLLETLTQTISDILHLLPRNTWDDSSSFDGVLREMLRAEDLLDEVNESADVRDDEVASLTMALEKRARWMEHQLTKLEDLHRDINSAAVRAVLSLNDRGWDATGFLPRQGDSLARFDALGQEEVDGQMVYMGAEELEEALADAKAKEAAVETELKQLMHRNCAQLWLA